MSGVGPDLDYAHEGVQRVVFEDAYADLWLRALRRRNPGAPWLARVERRVLGTLERERQARALLNEVLSKPLDALPPDVRSVLLVAVFRLLDEDAAPTAHVVDAAVRSVAAAGHAWAKGLTNAVLRKLSVDAAARLAALTAAHGPAFAQGLPAFWAERLAPCGVNVDAALRGLRRDPGLHLVDLVEAGDDVAAALASAGVVVQATPIPGHYVVRNGAGAFWRLPDEQRCRYAVQDLSIGAWLHVALATARAPLWDAFAAPGGKLLAATARLGAASVVGSDRSIKRLQLVRDEAARRGVAAPALVEADAAAPPWPAERRFATVFADVPCSASGTLPRHPDVATRLHAGDLSRLSGEQLRWLTALAPRLAPGGTLWYTTCSLFPEENEAVVERFLATHPDWSRQELPHPLDRTRSPVMRFWPHLHGTQGFVAQALGAPA